MVIGAVRPARITIFSMNMWSSPTIDSLSTGSTNWPRCDKSVSIAINVGELLVLVRWRTFKHSSPAGPDVPGRHAARGAGTNRIQKIPISEPLDGRIKRGDCPNSVDVVRVLQESNFNAAFPAEFGEIYLIISKWNACVAGVRGGVFSFALR